MATSKPQSFISWNSEKFLKGRLEQLYRKGLISFYMYIYHFAEPEDETGYKEKKNHYHVYLEPFDKVDKKFLVEQFSELEKKGVNRPHEIRNSDFANAYLYFIHDQKYLQAKGQTRKYYYKISDLVVSDEDTFHEKFRCIDYTKIKGFDKRLEMISNAIDMGYDFPSMVANGLIPIEKIMNYEKAYRYIYSVKLMKNKEVDEIIRNGGQVHG